MGPKPENQIPVGQTQARTQYPAGSVHVGRQQSQVLRRSAQSPGGVVPAVAVQQPAPSPQASSVQQPAGTAPASNAELILPSDIVTKTHISRCLREIEKIDDFFHQASVRGASNQRLPDTSKELEAVATANQLNLLQPQDRDRLKSFLSRLKTKAPVVHMSFPSEAGSAFLARLLEWFRREAHPYTVLHIGLQPELAAGCVMRTTNKMHDFSFRKRFEKSKAKLIASLEAQGAESQAEAEAEAESAAAAQQPAEKALAQEAPAQPLGAAPSQSPPAAGGVTNA